MPTQLQIDQFKKKARAAGYSELEISNAISKKIKNENIARTQNSRTSGAPLTQNQRAALDKGGLGMNSQVEQQPQEGFLKRTVRGLIEPGKKYLEYVGEAGAQGIRALTDKDISLFDTGKKSKEQNAKIDELSKKSRDLIKQATRTEDEAEKKRLLQQSRDIDAEIEAIGNDARRLGEKKTTFFEDEKAIKDRGAIIKTGIKRTAGGMSYAIPGGSTFGTAVRGGLISGALYGLSEGEDIDPVDIITGAISGGIGGGISYGLTKGLSSGWSKLSRGIKKIKKGFVQNLSDEAAQRINKATPTAWQRSLEEHGLDLNKLTEKYFKKGGTYDDMLGSISERGRGGFIQKDILANEEAITNAMKNVNKNTKFTIDEFVEALTKEKNDLLKLPGNEANAAALEEFIKGMEAQYGKGITPKRMLDIKRVADSAFGRAVTDENTGSAVAQAQKMVANAARRKLKDLLPAVRDALDNETELYTIRPVLSRARAILNTQGSTIRTGQLGGKSVLELLNPFTLADSYLADPKRASRFLQSAGEEVVDEAGKANLFSNAFFKKFGQLTQGEGTEVLGRSLGTAINAAGNEQDQMTDQGTGADNQIGLDSVNNDLQGGGLLDTDTTGMDQPQQHPVFGTASKDQVMLDAFKAGMNQKQLDEIEAIYDRFDRTGGGVLSEENRGIATDLRKEYISQTKENGYIDAVNSYRKIASAPDTAAGDVSLIFAYMKMLDPGSVVREGEFATAEQAAGVPERVVNAYNKALKGKKLSKRQREDFQSSAEAIFQGYQETQSQIDGLYTKFAQQYGVSPELLGIGVIGYEEPAVTR